MLGDGADVGVRIGDVLGGKVEVVEVINVVSWGGLVVLGRP